jgi:hypothetical protein
MLLITEAMLQLKELVTCDGQGSNLYELVRRLLWTKWHWDMFLQSISVSPAKKIVISLTYHSGLVQWAICGLRTKGFSATHPKNKENISFPSSKLWDGT